MHNGANDILYNYNVLFRRLSTLVNIKGWGLILIVESRVFSVITETGVTVELDATPSEAPTVEDFDVTVDGEAVEVTDVTEGENDKAFVLAVDLEGKKGCRLQKPIKSKIE